MELKEGLGISTAEIEWIFGIESAQDLNDFFFESFSTMKNPGFSFFYSQITVEDVSKKRSMDLRLLHGVAYGHPWFARLGYRFCHGSFGVTENNYDRAIDILSS